MCDLGYVPFWCYSPLPNSRKPNSAPRCQNEGPTFLLTVTQGFPSGPRGRRSSLPPGPRTNLRIRKFTSKTTGDCLYLQENPSPTCKCFHLIKLGPPRIIFHVTRNQLTWNFNCIYKNPFTNPHNITLSQEWGAIVFTGSAHIQGEGTIQGLYICRGHLGYHPRNLSTIFNISLYTTVYPLSC